MSNFNLNRLLLTIILLITMVGNSFAYSKGGPAPITQDDLKRYGPNSSIQDVQVTQYGVVTHYTKITLCSLDGSVCASKVFRSTQAEANIDGKSIRVETIDRGGRGDYWVNKQTPQQNTQFKRLSFKSSTIPAVDPTNAQGYDKLDMGAKVDLEINPYSELYNEISTVIPTVAVGIADAIKDMQASAAAAARLQEVYRQISEQTRNANNHLAENARNAVEAGKASSGYISALTADRMGQSLQSGNRGQEYQDYLKATRDPLTFREYELTPVAQQSLSQSIYESVKNRQVLKSIQYAEMLLHQKDPAQRAAAAKYLQGAFKDGVLRTQAFGAREASLLDRTTFKTPVHSIGGEVVRRVANKAQASWLNTRGLETMSDAKVASYISALSTLRAADESFVRGKVEEGLYLSEVASALLDFSRGIGRGAYESLVGAGKAVPEVAKALASFAVTAIRDDEAAVKQLWGFVKSVPGVLETMATHYLHLAGQIANGSAVQKGEAAGELASEILIALITDGAVAGVRKMAVGSELVAASSRIAQISGESAGIVTEQASKVVSQFTRAQSRAFLNLAQTKPAEALNIMRATTILSSEGASGAKDYLNIALRTSSKSTHALTDAVHSGVIKSAEQVRVAQRLLPALEKLPHQVDFRLVGSSEKMALIGRDMKGNVNVARDLLKEQGVIVETFELSDAAADQWNKLSLKYGGDKNIPLDVQRTSIGYLENRKWIQKLIDQGYIVIDANNPGNYSWSLYYDELERAMLLNARGQ